LVELIVRNEKQRATVIGKVAASFLTATKLFASILRCSLAALAEATHSALDLASAVPAFFTIRMSGKPADQEHMYDYGKANTLRRFFAALLLLVSCGWIIYEEIGRLLYHVVS
jgi:divalent metal cation (Fe/Co/Zn/Cd) transporter